MTAHWEDDYEMGHMPTSSRSSSPPPSYDAPNHFSPLDEPTWSPVAAPAGHRRHGLSRARPTRTTAPTTLVRANSSNASSSQSPVYTPGTTITSGHAGEQRAVSRSMFGISNPFAALAKERDARRFPNTHNTRAPFLEARRNRSAAADNMPTHPQPAMTEPDQPQFPAANTGNDMNDLEAQRARRPTAAAAAADTNTPPTHHPRETRINQINFCFSILLYLTLSISIIILCPKTSHDQAIPSTIYWTRSNIYTTDDYPPQALTFSEVLYASVPKKTLWASLLGALVAVSLLMEVVFCVGVRCARSVGYRRVRPLVWVLVLVVHGVILRGWVLW